MVGVRQAWTAHGRATRLSPVRRVAETLASLALLASLSCSSDLRSPDWVRRARAVDHMTDQARLASIAVHDHAEPVCLTAVGRLADPEFLGVVAFGSPNSHVQIAAVEKLADPRLLASLARHGRHPHARIAAIGRLADPAVLADIARTDPDPSIRQAAMFRLTALQEAADPDHV